MSIPTRIFKDLAAQAVIIENFGTFGLNVLTATNPSADLILISDSGRPIFELDFNQVLNQASAQAAIDAPATLLYLVGEFTEVINNLSSADVTAIAQAEATNIVDSAPATLDTLNELAAALGDDPNFAATTAASIGAAQGDATQALADAATAQADATQGIADAAAANANANTRLQSVVAGAGITVDNTDPINPIVAATGALPLFEFQQNLAPALTTSVATDLNGGGFVTYDTLVTTALPAGIYEFQIEFLWNHDNDTNDALFRVTLNGDTADLAYAQRQEPNDALGANTGDDPIPGSGSNQWLVGAGRRIYSAFSGVNTFAFQYATEAAGVETTVIRAVMSIRQVG